MKLSELAVCAVKLFVIFTIIEVLKELADTLIFIGMLPFTQLIPSIALSIIELALLCLLFRFSAKLAEFVVPTEKEAKFIADELFRLYVVKLSLYISSIVVIYRSLLNTFAILGSYGSSNSPEATAPSLHTLLSLSGPQIYSNVIFMVLGVLFFVTAIRINNGK